MPRFRGPGPGARQRNARDAVAAGVGWLLVYTARLTTNAGTLQLAQSDVHLTQEIIIRLSDGALGDHALQAELLLANAPLGVSNLLVDGEQGPGLGHQNLLCTPSPQRPRWPICSLANGSVAVLLGNFPCRLGV
jgi:hypothetical protein